MLEALSLPFFQRVLIAGLLASIAAGIMGTHVVVKRMSSVTGGLAHAAFGGIGLGYWLGIEPILGAGAFALLSGIGIGLAYRRWSTALDTSIAMFWSGGMAIGVVFIALSPGYAPDLTSYLFGSLLFVSWDYIAVVAALDVVIVLVAWAMHRAFEAVAFDEEFAEVIGVPVDAVLLILLALVSLSVVVLIRIVGVILAIALLTVPAAAARHWRTTLAGMMVLAVAFGALCTTVGIFTAYGLSERFGVGVPSGPLVILTSLALYACSAVLVRVRGKIASTDLSA